MMPHLTCNGNIACVESNEKKPAKVRLRQMPGPPTSNTWLLVCRKPFVDIPAFTPHHHRHSTFAITANWELLIIVALTSDPVRTSVNAGVYISRAGYSY